MSIVGPHNRLPELDGINETLLVELTRDLLATRGHRDLVITDGPGDGCRDVHSVDAQGLRHLAQVKFHSNTRRTISSREIGDLPLGMVRLNYRAGLLVTNAAISPQGKREFLDGYPGLALAFIDGNQLAAAVLAHPLLKALWFDGVNIARVANTFVLPIIARNLITDRPFQLTPLGAENELAQTLQSVMSGVQVRVRPKTRTPTSVFEPYRPPRKRTLDEGLLPEALTTELSISGAIPAEAVSDLPRLVLQGLLDRLPSSAPAIALRAGKGWLVPLNGESAGSSLHLDNVRALTLVRIGDRVWDEAEWLDPCRSEQVECDPEMRAGKLNWVQLYSRQLNACMSYELLTPPGESARNRMLDHREWFEDHWNRSLFYLVPAEQKDVVAASDEADGVYDWPDGRVFIFWLDPHLTSPFRSLSFADESEGDDDNPFRTREEPERSDRIRAQVLGVGGEELSPWKARHVLCVVQGYEPFPNDRALMLRTGDLQWRTEDVPSPIDPRQFMLAVTTCWLLPMQANAVNQDSVKRVFVSVVTRLESAGAPMVEIDQETCNGAAYLKLILAEPKGFDPYVTISERIARLASWARLQLDEAESAIREEWPNAARATEDYWKLEYGILFKHPRRTHQTS